jgi:hypothetical protein
MERKRVNPAAVDKHPGAVAGERWSRARDP